MITAKVKGLEQLHVKLLKLEAQTPGAMKEALMAASKPIVDYAVGGAPVASGALAGSIRAIPAKGSNPLHPRVRIQPHPKLWYGRFQEYGTSKMPAHPFLRPALDAGKKEAVSIFKAEMKRRIKAMV